jgi:[ribosomal protein S5]-alanine N-acetyltransferase
MGQIISWRTMTLESLFLSFPQQETTNLILRRIQATDSEALFRVLADDEVTRYYDDATFTEVSQASDQIESWENGYKNKRCLRWGIARKEDGVMIGSCGYYGFHSWHMRASIGYELARSSWRQGIMTEALAAIIALGFQEMGLNRIEAVVMPENVASIKLLEKLGFHNEGLLMEYENWGSKGFTDLCILSIVRKAWERSSPGS